jgi:hypothetical protein
MISDLEEEKVPQREEGPSAFESDFERTPVKKPITASTVKKYMGTSAYILFRELEWDKPD